MKKSRPVTDAKSGISDSSKLETCFEKLFSLELLTTKGTSRPVAGSQQLAVTGFAELSGVYHQS